MRHTFTANLGQRYFDATFLANNTAVFQTLVFATQTLVIFDRSENLRAKQTIALRLERTIVDRFRLFNFAIRPGTNFVRRGKANGNRIELLFLRYLFKQIKQCFHLSLRSG